MQQPQPGIRAPRCHRWTDRFSSSGAQPMRVLVVDDMPLVADAVSTALSGDGYETHVAHSGPEAVELCGRHCPGVVLMDIAMPGYDGFTAASILRKLPHTKHLVIIAYTALLESTVKARITGDEFDGYCQKGEPIETLVTLIESTRG